MAIRYLPLLAGLIPLIASFGALAIGITAGAFEACFPPLDGCMSISATGRKPPGRFLFRALMLPQAVLVFAVFVFAAAWLEQLSTRVSAARRNAIVISALVASIAIVVYVTFLGTREPIYEFMRRGGIYFYFVGVFIAQLLLALSVRSIATKDQHLKLRRLAQWMLILCLAPFALGLLNLLLKAVLADADASENIIEWIASISLQSYFLILFAAWRKTDMRASVSIGR